MFHRKPVSQDPVVVLLLPGKIQWVWEKPCPDTPPEGIDCVFMERAYLTQQVPDRLWRFFFFFFFWQGNLPEFPRNTIPGWGTHRTAQVYFTLCKKWEWMLPVVLFIPHLYIKFRSATIFAEALRQHFQVQPRGCQLRWNARCVD